ncbi:MAG TPA: Flp family type IVb pilin [Clostridiaceae bacterium]|nr:Flp family type IVb pilin [Clostridiaceae bacterium]
MLSLLKMFLQMKNNRKGQGMVEYGLIIGLIAIVVIIALTTLGGGLEGIFNDINDALGFVPAGD